MTFINCLILLASISTAFGLAPEDYVVQLKFKLREEKIPLIINNLLNNSLEEHNISTRDIIELGNLDKITLEQTLQVFSYFNISANEVLSVDSLQLLLSTLKIDFGAFRTSLLTKLNLSEDLEDAALKDLSIDEVKFYRALAGNKDIYAVLREGSYGEENVNKALQSIGKTKDEVFAAARDISHENLLQLSSSKFMAILKENGWSRRTFSHLWSALNITTYNVYRVEKFRNIFTNITDSLNENLTIAVFVGNNKLAIDAVVYKQFANRIDGVFVKIEAGEQEVELKYNDQLGAKIWVLTTKQSRDEFIEVTDNYNSTENCSYITITKDKVSVVTVQVQDNLTITKDDRIVFNPGSALICENHLYGLARESKNKTIFFDRFYTEDGETPEDDLTSGVTSACALLIATTILALLVRFALS